MSRRTERVNELIKQELGKLIFKDIGVSSKSFITITKVDTSEGCAHTKVYVSIFPDKRAEKELEKLNSNIYSLQKQLDKKLFMRPVPKISFLIDKRGVKFSHLSKTLEEKD